ncbi:MAG: hypothetical protein IH588_06950 [Anaerolineales bacterium]|nr:hypothetical protein [Anaerolineales bacterium]
MAKKNLWNTFSVNYLIPAIIATGIAIALFGNIFLIASKKVDTFESFNSLSRGLDDYYDFKTAWKPRLFSNALAAKFVDLSGWILKQTDFPSGKQMDFVVSFWTSSWYVLTCVLLICFLKNRSLFYIFGLYACVSFGYLFLSGIYQAPRVYPWDLPALFFFTAFVLLFIKGKYWWLFFLIPISIGFKETGMIFCLVFLFFDLPWRQRLALLAGVLVLSIGVKVFIDWYTNSLLFFTMKTQLETGSEYYFRSNLRVFKNLIPYFINSGTLIVLFLLPNADRKIFYLKLISIPFIFGIFLFGIADEFRVWFELIPFSLYSLDFVINGDPIKVNLKY